MTDPFAELCVQLKIVGELRQRLEREGVCSETDLRLLGRDDITALNFPIGAKNLLLSWQASSNSQDGSAPTVGAVAGDDGRLAHAGLGLVSGGPMTAAKTIKKAKKLIQPSVYKAAGGRRKPPVPIADTDVTLTIPRSSRPDLHHFRDDMTPEQQQATVNAIVPGAKVCHLRSRCSLPRLLCLLLLLVLCSRI